MTTTPTTTVVSERALLLLEIIARAEEPPTLNELMALIELPKATTHRFAALLERLGFVQRTMDGKRYEIGHRLTSLAIDAMRHPERSPFACFAPAASGVIGGSDPAFLRDPRPHRVVEERNVHPRQLRSADPALWAKVQRATHELGY